MKSVAIRADDLGYSEAVNYGIEKALSSGLIKTVEVMTNMPAAEHGLKLIEKFDVAVGLHANISAGKPILAPDKVSSLVDNGSFFKKSSHYYSLSSDSVVLDEAYAEIEAQLLKYKELTGKMPDYLGFHAVATPNFFRALKNISDDYDLNYFELNTNLKKIRVGRHYVDLYCESQIDRDYDPKKWMINLCDSLADDSFSIVVFHPGYVDYDILHNSSLTYTRANEVNALCDIELIKYIKKNCRLIDYSELFR